MKGLLSFYGSTPSYRPVLDVEDWGDLQTDLNTLSKRGRVAGDVGLIDDTMVRTIAVVGTPDECGRRSSPGSARSRSAFSCYFPATRLPTSESPSSSPRFNSNGRRQSMTYGFETTTDDVIAGST